MPERFRWRELDPTEHFVMLQQTWPPVGACERRVLTAAKSAVRMFFHAPSTTDDRRLDRQLSCRVPSAAAAYNR